MRKAALIYNPASGDGGRRRQARLQSALGFLRAAGVDAELVLTRSRPDVAGQTQHAIQSGCDTIFACGGDGTIHDLVQQLAGSPVALAILPMGTANALAHDLNLPFNLAAAAKTALEAKPRRIALGKVRYVDFKGQSQTRHFVIAAGVGVDAHLFYKLNADVKRRAGMAAYYLKAWHMWFSYPMTRFLIDYVETGSNEARQANVTELLAVHIRNFGGVLGELAPGASLDRNDLRLILCRTASRWNYLRYVTRCVFGCDWKTPGVELAYSNRVSCQCLPPSAAIEAQNQPRVYVEADGELLGTLPAEITVVPDALTLLAPT
jgi:diacylglycerol kinase (ATP)